MFGTIFDRIMLIYWWVCEFDLRKHFLFPFPVCTFNYKSDFVFILFPVAKPFLFLLFSVKF